MHYTEELWQQTREEMSRLKSELKAFTKARTELTDLAEKEEAKRLGIPYSASLPIDPRLAKKVDEGAIEDYEGSL